MKSRILFCSLLLIIDNSYAMELEQEQKTTSTRARQATVADIIAHAHEETEEAEPVALAPLPPLLFASSQRSEDRQAIHAIDHNAIQFSNMLTQMIEFRHHQEEQIPHIARKTKRQEGPEAHVAAGTRRTEIESQANSNKNVITLDSPDAHIAFIAELLNFLTTEQFHTQKPAQYQVVIDFIREHTRNFATISFADTYTILDYFDIPIARNALITMQDPLPLPKNSAEEIAYLEQLSIVFAAAQQDFINENNAITTNNTLLWQFFGRMLYPGCFANAKIHEMITFILQHQDIEQLVLGAYMQQYPQLYHNLIKKFKYTGETNYSSDGRMIEVQSGDDDLDLINIHDWSIARTIKNAYKAIFSPDGQTIAAFLGRNIELINLHNGQTLQRFTNVDNIGFSLNGKTVAIYSDDSDKNVELVNIHSGQIIQNFINVFRIGYSSDIRNFSPDGRIFAIHSKKGIDLINMRDESIIQTFEKAFRVIFSPDGRMIAVQSGDDVDILNIDNWSTVRTIEHAFNVAFSPDGKTVAVYSGRDVTLINIHDGSTIRTIGNAYNFSFSPNGQIIAVGQSTGLPLINIYDGSIATTFINTAIVKFSPDGRTIITSMGDSSQLQGYTSLREALLSPLVPPIHIEKPIEEPIAVY